MGSILESYDVFARVLLQALLNSLWPGLLLFVLVWVTLRFAGRSSATARHAIWLVCLLSIAAIPFLPTLPSNSIVTFRESQQHQPLVIIADNSQREPLSIAPATMLMDDRQWSHPAELASSANVVQPNSVASSVIARWSSRVLEGRLPAFLIALWLTISSVLFGRIVWSYLFLFRLRRQLDLVPAHGEERSRTLARVFGIRRRVRLFTSPMVGAPMTIGWLRPVVILPPNLLQALSDIELNSILAHELAHIKRWDYLTNLLQRLSQALLFFHPSVWVIGSQLSLERELACDDWAVKLTGEPRRYANCLARLIEALSSSRSFAAATGIIFGKKVISRRIEMILNSDRNATTSVPKAAVCFATGVAGLAVVLTSLFSPVIAVPIALEPQQVRTEATTPRNRDNQRVTQPAATSQSESATTTVPAIAPRASRLMTLVELPELPEIAELVDTPLAPVAADEPVFELLESMPAVAIAPRATTPLARGVSYAQQPAAAQQPGPLGRVATTLGAPEDRDSKPAIPESELLGILSDIVKRDADLNVKTEALRGIYRVRSDAGIDTLLQLYDVVTDVKTKGEIVSYLMRREGDNTKATAKILQIAKTEKDETLRSRALSQLAKVKGDEGANHLIQIYDTLQDSKQKQLVIRYLGYNKSRKAADKLIQIAKNDADPVVRQSAIRSLYAIDNRLYLDMRSNSVSQSFPQFEFPHVEFPDVKFDRLGEELELWNNGKLLHQEQLEQHLKDATRAIEDLHERGDLFGAPKVRVVPRASVRPEVKVVPPTPPIR